MSLRLGNSHLLDKLHDLCGPKAGPCHRLVGFEKRITQKDRLSYRLHGTVSFARVAIIGMKSNDDANGFILGWLFG